MNQLVHSQQQQEQPIYSGNLPPPVPLPSLPSLAGNMGARMTPNDVFYAQNMATSSAAMRFERQMMPNFDEFGNILENAQAGFTYSNSNVMQPDPCDADMFNNNEPASLLLPPPPPQQYFMDESNMLLNVGPEQLQYGGTDSGHLGEFNGEQQIVYSTPSSVPNNLQQQQPMQYSTPYGANQQQHSIRHEHSPYSTHSSSTGVGGGHASSLSPSLPPFSRGHSPGQLRFIQSNQQFVDQQQQHHNMMAMMNNFPPNRMLPPSPPLPPLPSTSSAAAHLMPPFMSSSHHQVNSRLPLPPPSFMPQMYQQQFGSSRQRSLSPRGMPPMSIQQQHQQSPSLNFINSQSQQQGVFIAPPPISSTSIFPATPPPLSQPPPTALMPPPPLPPPSQPSSTPLSVLPPPQHIHPSGPPTSQHFVHNLPLPPIPPHTLPFPGPSPHPHHHPSGMMLPPPPPPPPPAPQLLLPPGSIVESRLTELNHRLLQSTRESSSAWWESFVSEFFEKEATITLIFCAAPSMYPQPPPAAVGTADMPVMLDADMAVRQFTLPRMLIPRFFRTFPDGGCRRMRFMLNELHETIHQPQFVRMTCDNAVLLTQYDMPVPIQIATEGRLVIELGWQSGMRIRLWHFVIRNAREFVLKDAVRHFLVCAELAHHQAQQRHAQHVAELVARENNDSKSKPNSTADETTTKSTSSPKLSSNSPVGETKSQSRQKKSSSSDEESQHEDDSDGDKMKNSHRTSSSSPVADRKDDPNKPQKVVSSESSEKPPTIDKELDSNSKTDISDPSKPILKTVNIPLPFPHNFPPPPPMYFASSASIALDRFTNAGGFNAHTMRFLHNSAILEPMQELMSRHKAYGLHPRECLKATLFQRWQRIMAPQETSRNASKRRKRPAPAGGSGTKPASTLSGEFVDGKDNDAGTVRNSRTGGPSSVRSNAPASTPPMSVTNNNKRKCSSQSPGMLLSGGGPLSSQSPFGGGLPRPLFSSAGASSVPSSHHPYISGIMIVGEPTLMGEMGDDDERVICRVPNPHYDPRYALPSAPHEAALIAATKPPPERNRAVDAQTGSTSAATTITSQKRLSKDAATTEASTTALPTKRMRRESTAAAEKPAITKRKRNVNTARQKNALNVQDIAAAAATTNSLTDKKASADGAVTTHQEIVMPKDEMDIFDTNSAFFEPPSLTDLIGLPSIAALSSPHTTKLPSTDLAVLSATTNSRILLSALTSEQPLAVAPIATTTSSASSSGTSSFSIMSGSSSSSCSSTASSTSSNSSYSSVLKPSNHNVDRLPSLQDSGSSDTGLGTENKKVVPARNELARQNIIPRRTINGEEFSHGIVTSMHSGAKHETTCSEAKLARSSLLSTHVDVDMEISVSQA